MPTIINLEQIEMLKKYGGEEIVKGSFAIFTKESTKVMSRAKEALVKEDYKELASVAHGLKGSSRTLGIEKLGDAAYELELLCKQNKTEQVNAAFETVKGYFEEFMGNYQAILGI